MRARSPWLHLAVLWLASTPVWARADEASNWERLRSMPRERREGLLEDLKKFDGLSPAEKKAVRDLDGKLAKLAPADQARYRSVLRRYHLWVQSLPETQRNQLNAAAPGERMKLVAKFRAEERASAPRRSSPSVLLVADFGASTPFEMAHQIQIWKALSPEQRKSLEKIASPVEGQQRLRDLGKGLNLKAETKLLKAEEEELIKKAEAHLESKGGWTPALLKKKDALKDLRLKKRWAENYYFVENPPEPVKPDNLLRFESFLPLWIRSSFDHLPADEARRRLTILYRLLYQPGQEIEKTPAKASPAPAKEADTKSKSAPVKAPAKSPAATPF